MFTLGPDARVLVLGVVQQSFQQRFDEIHVHGGQ